MKNSPEIWCYTYAGLRVDSQMEILEWAGFERESTSDDADVRFCLDDRVQDGMIPAPDEPLVSTGEFSFSVPEIASYQVREGREIRVSPAPSAGEREVCLYLLGTAWAALCYQRDLLVLHASAVQVGGEAVAFCASPGMGKSTLAAWLMKAGHALVSDDLTRFEVLSTGGVLIHPSAPRLKLWQDALDALAWNDQNLERDHYRHEKFHLVIQADGSRQPLPLRAVYLLEWGDLRLSRLTGQSALQRFVAAATYRGALLEPMGKMGIYWQQCLELVRRVPVWELRRPRDPSAIPQIIQLIEGY